MNWLNRLWSLVTEGHAPITVGSRVLTPHGWGVITGAAVSVRLDDDAPHCVKMRDTDQKNNPNVVHPVQNLKV